MLILICDVTLNMWVLGCLFGYGVISKLIHETRWFTFYKQVGLKLSHAYCTRKYFWNNPLHKLNPQIIGAMNDKNHPTHIMCLGFVIPTMPYYIYKSLCAVCMLLLMLINSRETCALSLARKIASLLKQNPKILFAQWYSL